MRTSKLKIHGLAIPYLIDNQVIASGQCVLYARPWG